MARKKSKWRYINKVRRLDIRGMRFKVKKKLVPVILAAFALASVLFLRRWSDDFFRASPLFNVSKIELAMKPFLKDALSIDFYNIPRRCNIFRLNIGAVCAETQKRHPEFKSVVILRKPPDMLSVRIEYKEPFAFIKTSPAHKFFYGKQEIRYLKSESFFLVPIAADAIILPPDTASQKVLPILSGIDFQLPVIKVGSACADRKLPYAIKFLTLIESCWSIKDHRIAAADFSNTADVSVFLENGIEVKLGEYSGSIKKKMALLADILEKSRLDLEKIKYIDLRFSDVIIGPK